jgi:hypothetical protein
VSYFGVVREVVNVWKFELFVHTEDIGDTTSLAKWSSLDLLTEENLDGTSPTVVIDKQGQSWKYNYGKWYYSMPLVLVMYKMAFL